MMNKIFFIFLFLSIPLFSQIDLFNSHKSYYNNPHNFIKNSSKKVDSILTKSGGINTIKFNYFYNEYGKLTTKYLYYFYHGIPDLSTIEEYKYNSFGQLDSIISRNGNNIIDMVQVYSYYVAGGPIREMIVKALDQSEWVYWFKEIYSYDSINLIDTIKHSNWKDNRWELSSKDIIKKHSNGLIDSLDSYNYSEGQWIPFWRQIVTYDQSTWEIKGLLTKLFDGTNLNDYAWVTYNFDINSKIEIILAEFLINGSWSPKYRFINQYDEEKYYQNGYFEEYVDGNWEASESIHSIYNPDGFEEHVQAYMVTAYYRSTVDVTELKSNFNFTLEQNYPNPFNPITIINYSLPSNGFTSLKVFDVLGNEVATLVNEDKPAGNYTIEFNASNLSSGVYFYSLTSESFTMNKKMILMK